MGLVEVFLNVTRDKFHLFYPLFWLALNRQDRILFPWFDETLHPGVPKEVSLKFQTHLDRHIPHHNGRPYHDWHIGRRGHN